MTREIRYQDKPWFAHYEKGVPENMAYEDICLPAILERSAAEYPENMALLFEGYTVSYKKLYALVNRLAAFLNEIGIKKEDRVAILLPNIIPCVASYYATLKIGGIAVMNNPLYSDRELEYQLNDSESKALITLDLLGNRMINLRPRTMIKQIIYTTMGDYLPFPKNIVFPLIAKNKGLAIKVKPAEYVYKWKDVLANSSPDLPAVELSCDDIAMYQYTGGTTGVSKGVILTHGNLGKQVQQLSAWLPQFKKGKEVILGALPFFHMFGLTVAMNLAISMGWGNVLIPKPRPKMLLEAIKKYKPSFAPLVPTMYIGMLSEPDIDKADLSSIKGCFSGGSPLPVDVIRDFEKKTGAVIIEGYGLTETAPVTHIHPFAGKRKVGSIGLPVSDTKCRIVDMDDGKTDVPVGETGELVIKGPQVMQGYLNRPEETADTRRNGWLYTGDIAIMDQDGYFFIVDRIKDIIISGGFNVYPREIEEIWCMHPEIWEACAIGIPHPTRGESVKLFVVMEQGCAATYEDLIEYASNKLAKYKLPVEIEFRDELPKSSLGKILKKNLRA